MPKITSEYSPLNIEVMDLTVPIAVPMPDKFGGILFLLIINQVVGV
ncbi:MAG: hypothetical protein OXH16_11335 [Gemmatimonadetes bacterium]|nr:hypothetical protein [Gemmatimonadota bacterium]